MFRSSPFELTGPIADFDAIKIQLASPEIGRASCRERVFLSV